MSLGVQHSYWQLLQQRDLPSDFEWLSSGELRHLRTLKVRKRRQDWLLGRWTAKSTLLSGDFPDWMDLLPRDVEILPDVTGAPQVVGGGGRPPISISLSHRAGAALCIAASGDLELGCDLEAEEQRSPEFIEDYLVDSETELLADSGECRDLVANTIWSAKESALKSQEVGLRLDPRDLTVDLSGRSREPAWRRLTVRMPGRHHELSGWYSWRGQWILTVVVSPPLPPPAKVSRVLGYPVSRT